MTLASCYRLLAPIYDRVVGGPLGAARRASLANIPPAGRLDVLIDGMGTGLDLPHVPACHRYVGTDLVGEMLARARPRTRGLDCGLIRADSTRLPFAGESFDVVILHLIVAVVAEPAAVLAEAARVTRGGGKLLVWDKFLRPGQSAPLRRLMSPLTGQLVTRLDVVFEDLLALAPALTVISDQPAAVSGWFRRIVIEKRHD